MKKAFFLVIFVLNILWSSLLIAQDKRLRVFVSFPPQIEFVNEIGGDHVATFSLFPSGSNTENLKLSSILFKRLVNADLVVIMGVFPFEKEVIKKALDYNPKLIVVNFSKGVTFRKKDDYRRFYEEELLADIIPVEMAMDNDPYFWMSPKIVTEQLSLISSELSQLKPRYAEDFLKNLSRYTEKLIQIDKQIRQELLELPHYRFMVFQPVLGYFSDEYGLDQLLIKYNSGIPSKEQIYKIINFSKQNDATVIFSQVRYKRTIINGIAVAIQGTVVEFDPFNRNYSDNILTLSKKLKYAFLSKASK